MVRVQDGDVLLICGSGVRNPDGALEARQQISSKRSSKPPICERAAFAALNRGLTLTRGQHS